MGVASNGFAPQLRGEPRQAPWKLTTQSVHASAQTDATTVQPAPPAAGAVRQLVKKCALLEPLALAI